MSQRPKTCCISRWILFILAASPSLSTTRAARDAVSLHILIARRIIRGGDMAPDPIAANVSPIYMAAEQEIDSGSQSLPVNASKRMARFFRFRLLLSWRFNEPGGKRVTKRTIAITNKLNEKLDEARRMFLDRMAAISFTLINHEHDAIMSNCTFFKLIHHDLTF